MEEIKIDKKELWEQMKKDSGSTCYSVTFEAMHVSKEEDEKGQVACFVDEHVPVVSSNFQHAGLVSGILGYLTKYVDDIEDLDEFKSKYVVIGAFLEGLTKLSFSINKCMDKYTGQLKKGDIDE